MGWGSPLGNSSAEFLFPFMRRCHHLFCVTWRKYFLPVSNIWVWIWNVWMFQCCFFGTHLGQLSAQWELMWNCRNLSVGELEAKILVIFWVGSLEMFKSKMGIIFEKFCLGEAKVVPIPAHFDRSVKPAWLAHRVLKIVDFQYLWLLGQSSVTIPWSCFWNENKRANNPSWVKALLGPCQAFQAW